MQRKIESREWFTVKPIKGQRSAYADNTGHSHRKSTRFDSSLGDTNNDGYSIDISNQSTIHNFV